MNVTTAGAKALSHPTRAKILEVLSGIEPISPNRLALTLEEPLGNVSYHVKALEEFGMVELDHTEPRRGAVEHFYRRTSAGERHGDDGKALDVIAEIFLNNEHLGGFEAIRRIVEATGRKVRPR